MDSLEITPSTGHEKTSELCHTTGLQNAPLVFTCEGFFPTPLVDCMAPRHTGEKRNDIGPIWVQPEHRKVLQGCEHTMLVFTEPCQLMLATYQHSKPESRNQLDICLNWAHDSHGQTTRSKYVQIWGFLRPAKRYGVWNQYMLQVLIY